MIISLHFPLSFLEKQEAVKLITLLDEEGLAPQEISFEIGGPSKISLKDDGFQIFVSEELPSSKELSLDDSSILKEEPGIVLLRGGTSGYNLFLDQRASMEVLKEFLPPDLFPFNLYGRTFYLFPPEPPSKTLAELFPLFPKSIYFGHLLLRATFRGKKEDAEIFFEKVPSRILAKHRGLYIESKPLWESLGEHLKERGLKVAVAESCTGGLLSQLLTKIPGASNYFYQGLVTYNTEAKIKTLGIDPGIINKEGVVSDEVALNMALRVRKISEADFGLGITGLAGPGGGSENVPVGTVYLAVASRTGVLTQKFALHGSREDIRMQSACWSLFFLHNFLHLEGFL